MRRGFFGSCFDRLPSPRRRDAEARGRRAETVAVFYLRLAGWSILARRFSVGPGSGAGEIDVIARRRNCLAFVEVKTRASMEEALHAVGAKQRRRIERAAEAWLQRNPNCAGLSMRFDVIAVSRFGWPRRSAAAWRVGD